MQPGLQALTEKEKQTLRLLVEGYDAKSMARHLGLSVHTVNERLRDARRKLSTPSSREAARLLREAEYRTPELLGDMPIGAASAAGAAYPPVRPGKARRRVRRAGWLIGGLVMSMAMALFAAVALIGGGAGEIGEAGASPAVTETGQRQAEQAARQWLALVDARDWQASWAMTGRGFRKANTFEGWSSAAQGAHGTLGAALSRELVTADYSPAPPEGVWTVRFRTRFAGQREVVETLALASEDGTLRVVGVMLD